MEAKELRMGNYIRDIESEREGYVLTIGKITSTVKMEFSELTQKFEEYEPIELTEEWLLKFQFSEIDEKLYCIRFRLNRVDIYKMISGDYPFYFRFNQVDVEIKYVHQLQNLFFALTGSELELKTE